MDELKRLVRKRNIHNNNDKRENDNNSSKQRNKKIFKCERNRTVGARKFMAFFYENFGSNGIMPLSLYIYNFGCVAVDSIFGYTMRTESFSSFSHASEHVCTISIKKCEYRAVMVIFEMHDSADSVYIVLYMWHNHSVCPLNHWQADGNREWKRGSKGICCTFLRIFSFRFIYLFFHRRANERLVVHGNSIVNIWYKCACCSRMNCENEEKMTFSYKYIIHTISINMHWHTVV